MSEDERKAEETRKEGDSEIKLKIFTLNCWGLKFVSKLKKH